MPVENELKIVLRNSEELENKVAKLGHCLKLEQGYLNRKAKLTVRVRRQLESNNGKTHHFLQTKFKQEIVAYDRINKKVAKHPKTIEVSAPINQEDFEAFWEKAKGKLLKFRYLIKTSTTDQFKKEDGSEWQEIWEIDFFKTLDNETYFVMAEVEIPDGRKEPLFEVPDVIRDNAVYEVPQGDSRFSNTRLGKVKYATRLYDQLLSQQIEEGEKHGQFRP